MLKNLSLLSFDRYFNVLDMILESVFDSMAMMANIFSALIVTLVLYCIIAVQLFSNTFYKVCSNVDVKNITANIIPVQYCDSSSTCPKGFECVESIDNLPLIGTVSFANSWNALIQLVQVVLPDNWPPVRNPCHSVKIVRIPHKNNLFLQIIMNPVAQSHPNMVAVVRI